MWQRRVKLAVIVSAAALAVGLSLLTWLWHDRPNLDEIGWPAPALASAASSDTVTVTWLGVSTLLFDDGETQILIDGFFSRPPLLDVLLNRPIDNDAAIINYALDEFRMRRLAAIIPVHSHYDHAMDIGAIANRTSASVIGSASSTQIARGAGVPEDQITPITENQAYEFGRFTVTLLRSRHAPIGWRGTVPLDGSIDTPLTPPSRSRPGGREAATPSSLRILTARRSCRGAPDLSRTGFVELTPTSLCWAWAAWRALAVITPKTSGRRW